MSTDSLISFWIGLIILAILAAIILLVCGVICLIRYFRTRKIAYLVVGMLCTLLIPGCIIVGLVLYWLPQAFVMYAPAPPH